MRGVFLDWATVNHSGEVRATALEQALDRLELHATSTREQALQRVRDAEVVLTNKIRIDQSLMAAAPSLRLVVLAATGFNNVDLEAAAARGITVCNIRAYCTAAVTQHVFALMLALNQQLRGYQSLLREGAWADSPQFCLLQLPIHDLTDRRLGIVGAGVLGQSVARVAEAFGMQVSFAQRPGMDDDREGRVPMAQLLRESDVISLHCPLNPHTHHLIDAEALASMPEHALLINTARGAVVDPVALVDALRRGVIAGAGIDVLSQEPPVDGDPLLEVDLPNLIVTPHVAWASVEARQRAVVAMAEDIRAFVAGAPINTVAVTA